MQAVARLEICAMRRGLNIVLHYCTLLLTSSSSPVTRPTPQCIGHFGTLLLLYNRFCYPLFFVMCLVLLSTSSAKHSHSYGMDFKFPNYIVTYYALYFAQTITLKLSIVVKCSVLPPSVTFLCYKTTLVRKYVSINSILFDNKHHYRNQVP